MVIVVLVARVVVQRHWNSLYSLLSVALVVVHVIGRSTRKTRFATAVSCSQHTHIPACSRFTLYNCRYEMADVSDPTILEAYQDVRSDKTSTNWLLLDYESDRSDKLAVTQTGSGGLAELQEILDPTKASYAYVRVSYSNDKESIREKFIFVTWIGPQCKIMRKAKISVQAADVKAVLPAYSIDVPAQSTDDLKEDPIVTRLRKAGGASYDGI